MEGDPELVEFVIETLKLAPDIPTGLVVRSLRALAKSASDAFFANRPEQDAFTQYRLCAVVHAIAGTRPEEHAALWERHPKLGVPVWANIRPHLSQGERSGLTAWLLAALTELKKITLDSPSCQDDLLAHQVRSDLFIHLRREAELLHEALTRLYGQDYLEYYAVPDQCLTRLPRSTAHAQLGPPSKAAWARRQTAEAALRRLATTS